MKNRIKKIIICLFASFILAGCGNATCETTKEPDPTEVELATMAPDPTEVLPNAEIRVMDPPDGDCYQFMLTNVESREDFSKYVRACMDGNFDFNWPSYTSRDNFQSYNWDKTYWVSVTYVPGSEEDEVEAYIYVDVRNLMAEEKEE